MTYEILHPPSRPRLPYPIPALHQHEDERCSEEHLGIGGCPGLPHCRDWIIGTYNASITICEVTGDKQGAFTRRMERNKLVMEFARRKPLPEPEVQP